jgi:hypothetical protein
LGVNKHPRDSLERGSKRVSLGEGIDGKAGPVRIGWGVGLLTLVAAVLCGVVLPRAAVWSLDGSAGAAGSATFGGFAAC